MTACDEGAAPARDRNRPSQGHGRGMSVCDEGAAAGRGIGHLRVREEGRRLAMREQPQRVHDRGQELVMLGREKRDGGLR